MPLAIQVRVGGRVPRWRLHAAWRSFARSVPAPYRGDVTLVFAGRAYLRRLNRIYRGLDRATDVLSFPARDANWWPAERQAALGEIIICYPVAVQQANQVGHPVRQEVLELFVHGLAHLAGYDHGTKEQAQRMAAFEAKILSSVATRRSKN